MSGLPVPQTRDCLCGQADLTIETKGSWPVGRDAAACLGLAGLQKTLDTRCKAPCDD